MILKAVIVVRSPWISAEAHSTETEFILRCFEIARGDRRHRRGHFPAFLNEPSCCVHGNFDTQPGVIKATGTIQYAWH